MDQNQVEKDEDQSVKVYTSWRWLVGFFSMFVGVLIHIYCLQYLDLTLLAANSVTAVVAAIVLSTQILGEKFVCRYDLPALIFIAIGCSTIVLNANKTETEYTADEVKELLKSPRSLLFMGTCLFTIVLSMCILGCILRRLRLFENDVEAYESENGLSGEALILPARELKLQGVGSAASINAEAEQDRAEQAEDAEEVQRPARILIETLNDMPREQLD